MIGALAIVMLLAQSTPTTPPIAPMQQNQAPVAASQPPATIPAIPGIDRTFALAAMQGNAAELDMARLALKRSITPEVRSYAEKMLSEHMGLMDAMQPALVRVAHAVKPPSRLAAADQLAYAHLATIPQADFDRVYIVQQIGDHLATLTAFRTEADSGTDAQLKALTKKWLPTIQAHLELAVDITGHIGGATPFKSH